MKTKIGISLVLALLMIVSIFPAGTINAEVPNVNVEPTQFEKALEVTKLVSADGENWVHNLVAEIGQTVTFKITATYHALNPDCSVNVSQLKVVDTISPNGLTYSVDFSSSAYQPDDTSNPYVWDLTDDYGVILFDGQSVSIEFNVTLTGGGSGVLSNKVVVNGTEHCCGVPLQDQDSATVTVECTPGIEVTKKVWNETSGQWEKENLAYRKLGDIVKFQIQIVYNDCDNNYQLLNMEIRDELPDCLDYNYVYSVTTTGYAGVPTIVVDGKTIYWRWVDTSSILLEGGDSLTVEFETNFTQHCSECSGENCAYVTAWGCQGPQYSFEGYDCASINCQAPPTTFDKLVKDGENWAKEIVTYTGSILTFKIELVYNEEDSLTNVKFVDQLPCILQYVEGSFKCNIEEITLEIDGSGKILYFNATSEYELKEGTTITITFDTLVTGCNDCGCEAINKACVKAGCQEPYFERCDEVKITSHGNCPPSIPLINGPSFGKEKELLEFSFKSVDPNEDQIYYIVNFGDGSPVVQSELVASGTEVKYSHAYSEGVYKITAKAVDEHGADSGWTLEGYEHIVTIKKGKDPVLISVNKFGFGKVKAKITNNAGETLTGIEWSISFSRSGIFGFNVQNNGTQSTLNASKSFDINTAGSIGIFKFGHGNGEIKVKVNGEEYTKTFHGWVFAKIVITTA